MRCEPRLRPHSNSDGKFEEIEWLFRPDFAAGVGEKTMGVFLEDPYLSQTSGFRN